MKTTDIDKFVKLHKSNNIYTGDCIFLYINKFQSCYLV